MSLFSSGKRDVRFGALIEIGSGSIVVSIVKSDASKNNPEIIWSRREFASLKTTSSHQQDAKSIMAVLMNVILLINSNGNKALKTYDSKARIDYVQILITAPWSCTVSKTIEYSEDQDFTVTTELLNDLMTTAKRKIDESKTEKEIASKHGLTILSRNITNIRLNGYKTSRPLNQKVKNISVTQVNAIAEAAIIDAVIDLQRKVLPHAELKMYSFMMVFQTMVEKLFPQINDFCLIDITYEATEISIIKNGDLQYCTQTSIGVNTLARGIAKVLKIPHEEALVVMHEPNYSTTVSALSESKKEALDECFQDYQNQLAELFSEIGSNLSIPRTIFLHSSTITDTILHTKVMDAAKAATSSSHSIFEISHEILTKSYTPAQKKALLTATSDTGVLLAAQFFHIKEGRGNFIHE